MKRAVELKKIKWGIIGLGAQGENMARSIIASKNGILYFAASQNKNRAENFAKKYKAPYCGTIYDMLKNPKVEAVIISSKNKEHARHVRLAASAKKQILCEKPLALSMKDGRIIANIVKKHRVRFAAGFHLRHHPAVLKAKKIIASGKIGKISLIKTHWCVGHPCSKLPSLPVHMKWRENLKEGGGAFMARGTHLLDLIDCLTNKKPLAVSAMTNKNKKADFTAVGLLDYGDFYATIATSKVIPYLGNFIGIYGDEGNIELYDFMAPNSEGRLIFKTKKAGSKRNAGRPKAVPDYKARPEKLVSRSYSFKKENLWQKEIEDFGKALLTNQKMPNATLEDGLFNIAAANAFIKSAQSKKITKIRTAF
jgi:D-xylose 1-dehydrogenase (NADP+, D-xylono-1,5-lactone-forming)